MENSFEREIRERRELEKAVFGDNLRPDKEIVGESFLKCLDISEDKDSFLKSWSSDLQNRFPDGGWRTINGAKVFINNGKVIAGLDGFNDQIDKFFESKKNGTSKNKSFKGYDALNNPPKEGDKVKMIVNHGGGHKSVTDGIVYEVSLSGKTFRLKDKYGNKDDRWRNIQDYKSATITRDMNQSEPKTETKQEKKEESKLKDYEKEIIQNAFKKNYGLQDSFELKGNLKKQDVVAALAQQTGLRNKFIEDNFEEIQKLPKQEYKKPEKDNSKLTKEEIGSENLKYRSNIIKEKYNLSKEESNAFLQIGSRVAWSKAKGEGEKVEAYFSKDKYDSLVKKGLLSKDGGKYGLTELGKKEIDWRESAPTTELEGNKQAKTKHFESLSESEKTFLQNTEKYNVKKEDVLKMADKIMEADSKGKYKADKFSAIAEALNYAIGLKNVKEYFDDENFMINQAFQGTATGHPKAERILELNLNNELSKEAEKRNEAFIKLQSALSSVKDSAAKSVLKNIYDKMKVSPEKLIDIVNEANKISDGKIDAVSIAQAYQDTKTPEEKQKDDIEAKAQRKKTNDRYKSMSKTLQSYIDNADDMDRAKLDVSVNQLQNTLQSLIRQELISKKQANSVTKIGKLSETDVLGGNSLNIEKEAFKKQISKLKEVIESNIN